MSEQTRHFLDDMEYDWGKPEALDFYGIMLRPYGAGPRAEMIVAMSGIDRGSVNFAQPPSALWMQILDVAARAGRTRKLAQNALGDKSIAAYHPKLARLVSPNPSPAEAAAPASAPVAWSGDELVTGKQPTFLDLWFLHEGLRAAASVVRLGTVTRNDMSFQGTGFLIAPDTILTNHHVLYDGDGFPVEQVDIWFNYELNNVGRPRDVDRYEGDTRTIDGDPAHDWAIIRSKARMKSSYPVLSLRPSKPVATGDFVFIIQHPEGRPKKIGLSHNEVVSVMRDRVQYLTDTLPGSSGSPVCNELWEVVALHHRGVEGDARIGSIRRNQGIHIDRVVEGLTSRGILEPKSKS